MPRSVLLRHELPDGSWHYDWLIDPVGEGGADIRNLIAFRVVRRPDTGDGPIEAQRLGEHRRLYLDHQGPLPGGGRGTVERLAEWECDLRVNSPERLHVVLRGKGCNAELIGHPVGTDPAHWRFRRS